MSSPNATLLRRVLVLDAAISGATAALLTFAGGPLAGVLGVPEALLRYAGLLLIPFVVFVAVIARREVASRSGVQAIIALNIAWVAASVWLVTASSVQPNGLGLLFIIAQAIAVALFAELQYVGLRRAAR